MSNYDQHKNEIDRLLAKLGHSSLTAMQQKVFDPLFSGNDVWLTAPTGSGKTLAFLLPLVLRISQQKLRALIIVPTRELAIQTAQVARNLGSGLSVVLSYGGNNRHREILALQRNPDLIIGTPGRLSDHHRNSVLSGVFATVVLDEYDKSLEIGFKEEMKDLIDAFTTELNQVVLTSATKDSQLPLLEKRNDWKNFEFETIEKRGRVKTWMVNSTSKDKLEIVSHLLNDIGGQKVIVFVNHKESADRVGDSLQKAHFNAAVFHGGLDQFERETVISKFRNGTVNILVATDLAARGLDIPLARFVVHYHFPHKAEEMVHRNGRTGRMGSDGDIYFIRFEGEDLPGFLSPIPAEYFPTFEKTAEVPESMTTWQINKGRKDKISKSDIVGFLTQSCQIEAGQIGSIDLGEHQALIALKEEACSLITEGNHKIKKLAVRITKV